MPSMRRCSICLKIGEKRRRIESQPCEKAPEGCLFFFWKTHIPCVFRVLLRILKGNKKGWRTGKWFSSQVPWRTTIPGHNHYVQYNKKVKKVKRFAN